MDSCQKIGQGLFFYLSGAINLAFRGQVTGGAACTHIDTGLVVGAKLATVDIKERAHTNQKPSFQAI